LFFTATWCKPCQEFKHSLDDALMIDALKDITLIMIDADIDTEKEKIGEKYDVGSYPTFIRVNAKGEVIKQTGGGAWDENIPANMAPVLKAFMND
jgi:thiol-disulfide isomerase/thioredoxin